MTEPLYHERNRELQDRFDSRRIADRLEQVTVHDRFSDPATSAPLPRSMPRRSGPPPAPSR